MESAVANMFVKNCIYYNQNDKKIYFTLFIQRVNRIYNINKIKNSYTENTFKSNLHSF